MEDRRELVSYLRREIGPCEIVRFHRNRPGSCVVEVIDRSRRRWFGKQIGSARLFEGELTAYRQWTHALGGCAPELRHADPAGGMLVLSSVPGVVVHERDAEAYEKAGAILARLHGSAVAKPVTDAYWARLNARAEFELRRCRRLGARIDEELVRSRVQAMNNLTDLALVPCHGDYLPHNWLRDAHGAVRVVDFAESGYRIAATDLARLHFGTAWRRSHLMEAFLDGYGRPITGSEIRFVELHLAITAATAVGWGMQHGMRSVSARGHEVLGRLASGHAFVPRGSLVRRVSRLRRLVHPGR